MTLHLTLPFPPSVNRYWRRVGNRTVVSAEARKYREDVKRLIEETGIMAEGFGLDHVSMVVIFYPPDRRKRDLDNYIKQPQDALQHAGVFNDDCQVDDGRQLRGQVEAPGRIEVVIKPIPESWRAEDALRAVN